MDCELRVDGRYVLQGEIEALFLKHEGYIGAVGAFLHHMRTTKTRDE